MKKLRTVSIRLLLGLFLSVLLLSALFALTLAFIPIWGATEEEVSRPLPGDELTQNPILLWTNAISIDAPPDKVWPWIAQIGDTRGGFYSYTFIENKVGSLTGAEDYNVRYTNANEIHPEWQDPQKGEPIIEGMLKIRESEQGHYLLAESIEPSPFLWIWCWDVEPVNGGQSRLLSRFAIEVPETAAENPVMKFMLSVGGFVMHQNMMQSIQLRAEGGTEPAWLESVEIVLWLVALIAGLVAAGLYLFKAAWRRPLIVAVLTVIVIFILTFLQPAILIRVLLDAGLVAAVVWSTREIKTVL